MRRILWIGIGLTFAPCSTALAAAPPESPARYFPRDGLTVYAEFSGLDSHATLWRKSAAYRLLNETPAGAMLGDVITGMSGRVMTGAPMQAQTFSVTESRIVIEHAIASGFAVGVWRDGDDEQKPADVGFVLRGGAKGPVKDILVKAMTSGRGADGTSSIVAKPGGRKITVDGGPSPQPGTAWWVEGDDLAVSISSAEGADVMIDALLGKRPSGTTHPEVVALGKVEEGFTPVGFAFADAAALKTLPPTYAAYGLDRARQVDYRWGFHGEALMTVTRIASPAPRAGLLGVFDQPTFDRKGVPALPPGVRGSTTFSVDMPALFDRIAAGFANTDPNSRATFEAFEKSFRTLTGQRLRDDVLPHLGPKVTVYALPARNEAPTTVLTGLAQGLFQTAPTALVVEVQDPAAFSKILDDMAARLQESLDADSGGKPPPVRVRSLKGTQRGYVLSVSPMVFPIAAGSKPTILVHKSSLVIGSTTGAALATVALLNEGGTLPAGDPLTGSINRLPGGMVFAHVSDDRRSLLPELIANLPGIIQWSSAANLGPRRLFGPNGMPVPFWNRPALLNIDPDRIPSPDQIRPFLFPSEFSLTTDDQALTFTTREAFPALNPVALAPVAAVMFVPAYNARRAAGLRARSVNNLKQIGLAMHNYHSANNHFPAPAIVGKNGKPLLSWRVAILPYIEQGPLYNEFKLDEPWDSPNNKPLLARMPAVFAIPNVKAAPGMTFYRGFSGGSTLFDPKVKDGVGIAFITDGTSNTVGVVEARTAVPWTKPGEEIAFDPQAQPAKLMDLPAKLGGHFPGGFNALMLDGSVRFIKQTVNINVLRALITRDQGEVISADSY